MRKLFLLCLICGVSYNAYSSEEICSGDMISANDFNNFIFSQEQPFNDSLKEIKAAGKDF
ncbi:hypothetical protein [Morganella psychrotolerans]|uniref:Uncharacterized protein n=1 Tax=Morganella psychrotolerans TaxID=368603 RepID=A0A1B8HQ65_9GAMM|nr:hypothetical protein [Morganella psychrotolerans]OBU11354.1 hypothetical protein AYY17_00990 [Morganella psychrotolerans]